MRNKMLLPLLIMIAGVGLLGFFAPWWVLPFWIVIVAAMMMPDLKRAILCGSLSFVLVHTAMAVYMVASDNNEVMKKTGLLLAGLSMPMMIVAIVVISLITGALSGWLGGSISLAWHGKKPQDLV